MQQARTQESPWQKELDDIARAFSGAFLFGMPLLFTMEMWWIGTFTDMGKLMLILVLTLAINVLLNWFEGFKRESSFVDAAIQSVESVAVGAIASTVVLTVLNRISLGDPLDSILGKIIVQTMPLSIGASVANAIFQPRQNSANENKSNSGSTQEHKQESGSGWRDTLVDIGTTVGGGIFIGFAIAPTEEVPMLSAEMTVGYELALIALTLVLTYVIVFESGFNRASPGSKPSGPFQHPITETVLAYVVALIVAAGVLILFDQITASDPLPDVVSRTLVLGLPTALGGAAGRLLI
jgi:putative integral membrane protein (TIGR02587 family)